MDCADVPSVVGKSEILKYLTDSIAGKELGSEEKENVKRLLKGLVVNIYGKARWQIEGGIPEETVVSHFKFMFDWLNEYRLLNECGLETLTDGIDEEAVLTDEMVNISGKIFLTNTITKIYFK